MRRFAFLPVFLLLLPSVLTLAAPTPAAPAPAAKTQAAAPAKPAVSAAKQAPAPAKTQAAAPAATAPAPVKPAAAPAKPAATVQPVYPEVLFRPLLRAKQSPNNFADPARAAELFLAREKLIQNLLLERRRILTADPKAREIHAKIMELNKQLAVVLESKRSVRELSRDLMLVDARIDALERKKPAPPATPAAQPQAPAQPAPAAAAKPQAAPQVPAPAAAAKPQAPASK